MILVIGDQGRMGQRYTKILADLKQDFYGVDIAKQPWDYSIMSQCDRAIIATPADTHFAWCMALKIPWLCEKPLSKSLAEVRLLAESGAPGKMVNNWENAFCIALQEYTGRGGNCCTLGDIEFYYDNAYSGEDGIWDFIQLIHLCGDGLHIKKESKELNAYIKKRYMDVKITQDIIERSYHQMIKRWLDIPPVPGDLDAGWGRGGWDLKEALIAHEEVMGYDLGRYPG